MLSNLSLYFGVDPTENYLKFYDAIKLAYPDIQMISNCDASKKPLNHPAELYDFHVNNNNNVS